MAVLILDTATEVLAAGIGVGDTVSSSPGMEASSSFVPLLASSATRVPRGHSRLLQPAIAHLFQQTGIGPKDLTAIGVGVGPGSYTGVRIGVSTAKAMAFALQIPLVPLSTLAGMAGTQAEHSIERRILSLLYARRGRAYGAVFERRGEDWTRLCEDKVESLDSWRETMQEIRQCRGKMEEVVVHDFRPQYQLDDSLKELGVDSAVALSACCGNFAEGLAIHWTKGNVRPLTGQEIHTLEPVYVLEVEAEVKRKEATASGHAKK